jgi:hypothetical protein
MLALVTGIDEAHSMKKGLTRRWADFSGRLERDPASRRWMVACIGCGRAGLRADAPAPFWNRHWLERLGRIRLDDIGLCEMCHGSLDAASSGPDFPG